VAWPAPGTTDSRPFRTAESIGHLSSIVPLDGLPLTVTDPRQRVKR
jgi:hypothetical protein